MVVASTYDFVSGSHVRTVVPSGNRVSTDMSAPWTGIETMWSPASSSIENSCAADTPNTCTLWFSVSATKMLSSLSTATPKGHHSWPSALPGVPHCVT